MCNDQVFDWLPFFYFFYSFKIARCYLGPISGNISAAGNSQQGQTNKYLPSSLFSLASDNFGFQIPFLLPSMKSGTHAGYWSVASLFYIRAFSACAKNNGVCAPVCNYSFVCVCGIKSDTHTHTHTHTQTRQWWLVMIIRTSNEMVGGVCLPHQCWWPMSLKYMRDWYRPDQHAASHRGSTQKNLTQGNQEKVCFIFSLVK